MTPPGERVICQTPAEGNPLNTTLPVAVSHVGWTIVPGTGGEGIALTYNEKVAMTAEQGNPEGLFVVTVIVTVFPISAFLGVYVNANGDFFEETGLTDPDPSSLIVTLVALPPKILPLIVMGAVPQVLPRLLLNNNVGGFLQSEDCPEPITKLNRKRRTRKISL